MRRERKIEVSLAVTRDFQRSKSMCASCNAPGRVEQRMPSVTESRIDPFPSVSKWRDGVDQSPSNALLGEELHGVGQLVVDPNLVMQVRACGTAGGPDIADDV